MVGFVRIGPRLDEGKFEVVVNSHVRIGGRRVGQDPDLCVSFPLVDFGTFHVGQSVRDLLSSVCHNWVCGVDKLIQAEFVEKFIGLSSVSVKDGRFFSLEGVFISQDRIWLWRRYGSG